MYNYTKSGTLGQVKHLLRLVSDRRTYAIIQSETLGHIEIITQTECYKEMKKDYYRRII